MAISIEEEIGKRYGRLTVVGFVERRQPPGQSSYQYFSCLCDCGVERVLRITSLRVGNTRSCGCLQRDIASRIKQKNMAALSRLSMRLGFP